MRETTVLTESGFAVTDRATLSVVPRSWLASQELGGVPVPLPRTR